MKIYDITRELLSAPCYPGDKVPIAKQIKNMDTGDIYNLTELELCVHNGTHMDAPNHFLKSDKGIDQIDLTKCIGECTVIDLSGVITSDIISKYLRQNCKRYLIKGNIELSLDAVKELIKHNIVLIGVEGLTVGPLSTPMEAHIQLLKNEIVILENLDLELVEPGEYVIYALPLKIKNCDGAPCRAVLINYE